MVHTFKIEALKVGDIAGNMIGEDLSCAIADDLEAKADAFQNEAGLRRVTNPGYDWEPNSVLAKVFSRIEAGDPRNKSRTILPGQALSSDIPLRLMDLLSQRSERNRPTSSSIQEPPG